MRPARGMVLIKGIIEKASDIIDLNKNMVTQGVIIECGDDDSEVKAGMTVIISPTRASLFTNSPDGTAIISADLVLAEIDK